jgi:predicted GNAT family acetyltransferase
MTDAAPDYEVRDNPDRHRFEVDLGDGTVALAAYMLSPGKITFTHTEVPEKNEGKGVGTLLIRAALASARERGLRVVPVCRFFAAYMKKHEEVQDLVDPSYRPILGLDPA